MFRHSLATIGLAFFLALPTVAAEDPANPQAEWHRAMADLIEAKATAQPDQAKIDRLTQRLGELNRPMPQGGPGRGYGWRGGRGGQGGPGGGGGWGGGDAEFQKDRDMFHYLLGRGTAIKRTVTKLDNGVETLTESDDPEVAATIQKHVESMHKRVKEGRPIHMRDPLFAAVFANARKITIQVEHTKKGVKVVETSNDPYVAKLIQAHAEVVNLFIANGFAEARANHAVPKPDGQPK